MIGQLDPKRRSVTVVGAGMAGLVASYQLDRAGYEVRLIEEKKRAGGLVATSRTSFGLSESAAHSLLATPPVVALCAELGVELVPVNPESKARYVARDGKLRRFPLTWSEALGAARRALLARADARPLDSETMADWAERHLGPAARDYLISPFLAGIHAARPEEIGLSAAFPALRPPGNRSLVQSMLARRRPKRARAVMMAPRDGMGALAAALEKRLSERLGDRFERGVAFKTLSGVTGNLMLTVPASEAARLLEAEDRVASLALGRVKYVPMVSVTVFAEKKAFVRGAPRGVGFLAPARENRRILGALFNSSAFKGRVSDSDRLVSLTVMLGGSLRAEALMFSDDELKAVIREELAVFLGLSGEPASFVIHRWPFALPRYSPELSGVWSELERSWCARPGRILFGNYTGQLSIRGMIESAASLR